jgi:branched-subunit amino acid transport protein
MNSFLFSPALSSPAQLWLTILLAGVITYGIRLSFILVFGRWQIPASLQSALRFVPPAVLTAIIFPELLVANGSPALSLGNARLLAGALAILVAWRTKSAVITILVGMGALWLFQWIFSLRM